MGRSKQLLPFRGKTLLRGAAEAALSSGCHPIVVVLGSDYHECIAELKGLEVQIVRNADWSDGIDSSIRCGIRHLMSRRPEVEGAAIMLCDQPLVTGRLIDSLVAEFRAGFGEIVATDHGDSAEVPAIFAGSLFESLCSLPADQGANTLIAANGGKVSRVAMPVMVDIDTPEDYEALMLENR